MILYNTLSRKKEPFTPLDGKTARIYSCGPTVYNTAHIGNMRPYVFADILKKSIEFAGFSVHDVMNTTDVGHLVTDADDGEDKVETAARKAGTTPQQIAQKYTNQFFADCEKLNIRRPKIVAPATEYIQEMIGFVKALEQKGLTYTTSDGVYFDSSRFPDYTRLSGKSLEGNRAGERVDMGEKRNANDFALWKFVNDNAMQKWGYHNRWGCPGWHIECSAIAMKELGETFDIHTGGIDHIPIHHTNEIAQTESLTGKPMAQFWMHNEFITIDGGKMSKSLGNIYTLADIESRGFSPMALRYYYLLSHYRSILNFTWDGLQAAQCAYNNLVAQLAKHAPNLGIAAATPAELNDNIDAVAAPSVIASSAKQSHGASENPLLDDLNTPKVLAAIWDLVKQPASSSIYKHIIELDTVLSLDLESAVQKHLIPVPTEISAEIIILAVQRDKAKKDRDYALADKLRGEIAQAGFEIKDTKDGYLLTKASK